MLKKTYVFDIDGTICSVTQGNYEAALPKIERIKVVNDLHRSGNTIIFYTARGMGSFKNIREEAEAKWKNLTEAQLHAWGVSYDFLFMGKPSGDLYVDDKAMSDQSFFS